MCRRMIYVVAVMMLGLVPMNPVYGYDPGSPDLLAWWTFDEGAGTVVGDATGNGNHGTLEDSPIFVDGQFGQALAFDNSRVAIGASDSLIPDLFQGSFTLAAWINATRTGNTWQQIFRSIRSDDTSNDTLFINNGGKLSWRGRVGGDWAGGMCETAPHVVPADQWTHVAVTGDGTNFRIYVNGALSQESAFQTTDGTNSTYYIGGDPSWTGESYTGMIDDVRIYNMALTELEILVTMEGVELVDVTAPGDIVQGVPNDGDWPTAYYRPEIPEMAIDDDIETKYLHFKGDFDPDPGTGGAGLQVTPSAGATIVTGLTFTTANDFPGRDPIAFELSGSNVSINGPYELIASGDIVDFAQADAWPRFTMNAIPISFDNDVAYAHYQLIFTAIRAVGNNVNSMQIAEVELLGVPAPASAGANIILVTEAIDWDLDGLRDDHTLETFLVSEGHSVDVRPDYWKVLTPDKIDELNAADLIIFSRLAWSGRYNQGNETNDWNSLTTPLLQMNAHFARNDRWKWVNSGMAVTSKTPDIFAEAVKPNHPVFRGVLTAHEPIDRYDDPMYIVEMIDPLVGTGLTSFIGSTDMGNGQLISKSLELDMGWIAEWDVGVEFFEGCGQYAGGRRMLFCAGTQEIQYYDYDRQEVITTAQGELNLTAEGLQMFRNAITYLLGGANIILVTEEIDRDWDGLRDDHSLESFLISEGHSVDVRPEYWNVLTPEKIAELNAADLIIVSRLAWSTRYNQDNEKTEWNSLTTPLLTMNSHFARNIRWKWVNSDARAPDDTSYIYAGAVDSHHPIFQGVPMTLYDPTLRDGPLNAIQMIDPLVGAGFTAFIDGTDMGNGQLIAKPVGLEMGWIADWDAGVEFYEGAGQFAGGKRMLFCAGTYFDPDIHEVITTTMGELNLTAEGLQMFRNAIDYLLRPEFTDDGPIDGPI